MRSKLPWIIAIAVGFIALYLVLSLSLPAPAPYMFLHGHEAIHPALAAQEKRILEDSQLRYTAYSFKGDFDDLLRQADSELKAAGFVRRTNDGGSVTIYRRSRPKAPESELVCLYRDLRLLDRKFGPVHKWSGEIEPGWITIMVHEHMPRSLFGRFRDWVGL